MDSSRVFVHGLPSNLSTEEFRKHFSNFFAVTDAKYISHRRIGYVGFKTHDEAQKAIKYFNKSFIRTSRIYVELARPVRMQHAFVDGLGGLMMDRLKYRLRGTQGSTQKINRKNQVCKT